MSQPTYEEALAHFGVKGQKWGHRKTRVTGPQIRSARRKYAAERTKIQATTKSSASKKTALKKLSTSKEAINSARTTRGEKAALLLIGNPILGGATILSITAVRKSREKRAAGN